MKSFTETKTTTFTPDWIKKDFMLYEVIKRVRKDYRKNKMDKCKKCKHQFEEDEMVALASFGKKGNQVLCQSCADELMPAESI